MSTPTITLTRGLPAAGKTTWAKAWVAEKPNERARVNRDDLRAMLFAEPTYEWQQEQQVTEVQREAVRTLIKAGRDVVCDDTHLRPKYVREWARFAAAIGADIDVIEFPIAPEEAIERDAARACPVGEEAIRRMVGKYLQKGHLLPVPDETFDEVVPGPYMPPEGGIPAVLVDIDGTLALHNGRSPYDLDRCGEDLPNRAVIAAVHAAAADGVQVVYCSGREDVARKTTAAWLTEHVGVDGPLYMRAADDKRKDSIVKRELFDQHIRNTYDVLYVLDDRNQVVEMWRSLGLTCFQVAPGDF